jgi:hypothetical protein
MSVIFGAWASGPLIDQVRPGYGGRQDDANAPPPVASEFLSQNHGPLTTVSTATDTVAPQRNIVTISFTKKEKAPYRFYIHTAHEAERAFHVIVEYLFTFSYDAHLAFFHLVSMAASRNLATT